MSTVSKLAIGGPAISVDGGTFTIIVDKIQNNEIQLNIYHQQHSNEEENIIKWTTS